MIKKIGIATSALLFMVAGTAFAQQNGSIKTPVVEPVSAPEVKKEVVAPSVPEVKKVPEAGATAREAEQKIKALKIEMEMKIKAIRAEYKAKIEVIRAEARAKRGEKRDAAGVRRDARDERLDARDARLDARDARLDKKPDVKPQ